MREILIGGLFILSLLGAEKASNAVEEEGDVGHIIYVNAPEFKLLAPRITSLEYFYEDHIGLDPIPPQINSLYLVHTSLIAEEKVAALKKLEHLYLIKVAKSGIKPLSLSGLFPGEPPLKTLVISETPLRDTDGFSNLRNLEYLALSGLLNVPINCINSLFNLKSLKVRDCCGANEGEFILPPSVTYFSYKGIGALNIEMLLNHKALKKLELEDVYLSREEESKLKEKFGENFFKN